MLTYLRLVASRALKRSVLLSDQLSIMAGVLMPALVYVAGNRMQDQILTFVSWAIIITVILVVLTRLLTAPFFIWKENQAKIAQLEHDLAEPARRRMAFFQERFLEDRYNLAKELTGYGFLDVAPTSLSEFDPDAHINGLVRNAVHFLGDAQFRQYWDTFCAALRRTITGAKFVNTNCPGDGDGPLAKQRLNYDFAAMKVASTAMVFMLTENYDHREFYQTQLGELNERNANVIGEDMPASLWTETEPQPHEDRPEETRP